MGMFDELRCEYPLPDGFDPTGHWFQTKDTPDQYLIRYVLRADGALVREATGEPVVFHGALTFYIGNISGSGPKGVITSDDTPPWWAEYTALYDHGALLKLEGAKQMDTESHWITREAFYAREKETPVLDVTFLARLITLSLNGAPFPHPDRALPLLLGTAATESHLTYTRQINGPARGYWQIEPATETDCWTNYLSSRRHLVQVFVARCGVAGPNVSALEHNLVYGILLARLVYFRAPEALPAAYDLEGQSAYWKQYYNTPRGKGTVEKYLEDWHRLVAPSWPGQGEEEQHA